MQMGWHNEGTYLYSHDIRCGYASALAWIMLVIIGAFTGVLFLTKRFWVYEEGV